MKRKSLCLALALLLCLPLAGCRSAEREAVESEILALREENMAKAEGLADGKSPEPAETPSVGEETAEEPEADQTGETEAQEPARPLWETDWDGILSSEYILEGNRTFIELKHKMTMNQTQRGCTMLFWLNLMTGDSGPICPDPLCPHDDFAVCPYLNVRNWYFLDANTAFGNRDNFSSLGGKVCVWRYDLASGTCREFYKPKSSIAMILFASDGVLYLCDQTAEIGDRKAFYTYYLEALDAASGNLLYEIKLPEITAFYSVINGRMLFADSTGAYFSDMRLENREKITDGYLDQWYWDEHTSELWFSQIDDDKKTGRVFQYKDGVCEQIDLPENLYFFQLTNTKIYYTTFEPVYLGNAYFSMFEGTPRPLYSDSGNTIFAVSRDDPDESPTVVYDTEGARVLSIKGVAGYRIFGSKLCYYDIPLIRETHDNVEYVAYSLAEDLPLLVVDLATGEEEIIRFD